MEPNEINPKPQNNLDTSLIVMVAVIIIIAGGIYFYVQRNNSIKAESIVTTVNSNTQPSPTASSTNEGLSARVWGTNTVPLKFQNKIAFLRGGDIWIANYDGSSALQITNTDGKVDAFLFSPSFKYLVYTKNNKTFYLQGDDGPDPSDPNGGKRFDLTSLVIINLVDGNLIREFQPSDIPNSLGGDAISLGRWVSNERFDIYTEDGEAGNGPVTYEISTNTFNPSSLFMTLGDIPTGNEFDFSFSDDGTLLAHSDFLNFGTSTKADLHIINIGAKTDQIVLSKENSFGFGVLSISHDDNYIAFLETSIKARSLLMLPGTTTLQVIDINIKINKQLYTLSSQDISSGSGTIKWSSDNNYIGIFSLRSALIFDLHGNEVGNIKNGSDYNFLPNDDIEYSNGKDIYRYSLSTKTSQIVIPNSSSPIVL